MATKKTVGDLIKEARTAAGLTQEQLAGKVEGVSASDISKAERGEKVLTQAALKQVAKATGITQKSLLEAAAGSTAARTGTAKKSTAKTSTAKTGAAKTGAAKTGAAKTSTAKTSAAKTNTAKTSAAKTNTAKTSAAKTSTGKTSTAKKTASSGTSVKLTATEKKFIELYRKASADQRKAAEAALKGTEEKEEGGLGETLLGGVMNLLGNLGG